MRLPADGLAVPVIGRERLKDPERQRVADIFAKRDAELARLRSISGPQPHRGTPADVITADADAQPHPSAD